MKKLFQFVMVAAAAFAVASCGNKNASGSDNDSTSTEQVAEKQEAKEEEKENLFNGPGTLDREYFSAEIPQGWKVTRNEKPFSTAQRDEGGFLSIGFNQLYNSIYAFEKWSDKKADSYEKQANKTINGINFKVFKDKSNGAYLLGTPILDGEGTFELKIYAPSDDKPFDEPGVKAILESLKLK